MPLSFPEDFPFTLAPVIFTFCIDSERGIPPETQGRRVQGRLMEVGRRKPCPEDQKKEVVVDSGRWSWDCRARKELAVGWGKRVTASFWRLALALSFARS